MRHGDSELVSLESLELTHVFLITSSGDLNDVNDISTCFRTTGQDVMTWAIVRRGDGLEHRIKTVALGERNARTVRDALKILSCVSRVLLEHRYLRRQE